MQLRPSGVEIEGPWRIVPPKTVASWVCLTCHKGTGSLIRIGTLWVGDNTKLMDQVDRVQSYFYSLQIKQTELLKLFLKSRYFIFLKNMRYAVDMFHSSSFISCHCQRHKKVGGESGFAHSDLTTLPHPQNTTVSVYNLHTVPPPTPTYWGLILGMFYRWATRPSLFTFLFWGRTWICDFPVSVSRVAGTLGEQHYTWLQFLKIKKSHKELRQTPWITASKS